MATFAVPRGELDPPLIYMYITLHQDTKSARLIAVCKRTLMNFLLSLISSLDFKPLFVPIEANLGIYLF